MSRITGKDTKPEIIVRKFLHASGLRFRIHVGDLAGKPDIVLPKWKTVIFVHGCFWHRHEGCRRSTTPIENREYWLEKFRKNVDRDKRHIEALEAQNWKVFILWECEVISSYSWHSNLIQKIRGV